MSETRYVLTSPPVNKRTVKAVTLERQYAAEALGIPAPEIQWASRLNRTDDAPSGRAVASLPCDVRGWHTLTNPGVLYLVDLLGLDAAAAKGVARHELCHLTRRVYLENFATGELLPGAFCTPQAQRWGESWRALADDAPAIKAGIRTGRPGVTPTLEAARAS